MNGDMTRSDELIEVEDVEQSDSPQNALDSDSTVQARFRRVKAWRTHAANLQRDNRALMMRDHDFYDSIQWDAEDAAVLRERGQAACVFNLVKTPVDWLIGTERRTRIDGRVLPRGKEDSDSAEAKTNLLKYISDVNKYPYHRSRAWTDTTKSGVGWIEAGICEDPTAEPLFNRYEDWRNIWYDPLSVELDLSDARFLFREKYVDLDVAIAMFPGRAGIIRAAAINGGEIIGDDLSLDDVDAEADIYAGATGITDEGRSRVKLTECWYRVPCQCQIIRGEKLGPLNGADYDPNNPAFTALVDEGLATVYDAIPMKMRCMVYCAGGVLQDEKSPYRHNRFPFVPFWGYREKRTNAPYGAIRPNIDAQQDFNKRRSKALFILSTNQVVADNDAVEDWDELAEEVADPRGIMKKKPGSDFEIRNNNQLAEEHVMLMQHDREYIEAGTGVTDEQMGRATNAQSGKAILARQNQGHATTAELFDNLRLGHQLISEINLSLVEQFYTDEKKIRILGDRGKASYVTLNQEQEDGSVINDVTMSVADYVVDQTEFNASMRQSAAESLMNIIGQMGGDPELARALIDLAVDLFDIPGKEEALRRIRGVTGMKDPDADGDSPEEMEAAQAEQGRASQEAELQAAMQQLEIAERQAKTAKMNAEAKAKEAGIVLDQEKVRIQKAEALHKIQSPKPEPYNTNPSSRAQGQGPIISPYRYPQTR